MIAYFYITASLVSYPLIGRLLITHANHQWKTRRAIIWLSCTTSCFVILGLITHVVTISQNLNWFLVTSIYLTISICFRIVYIRAGQLVRTVVSIVSSTVFGLGYLVATIGFFFVLLVSFDLDTDQRKWLTEELIYTEQNIGQGPDPSNKEKKIEVYRKIKMFPLLAYRIHSRIYDMWKLPLKKNLDILFSAKEERLYLGSSIGGGKTFILFDTITLPSKHWR